MALFGPGRVRMSRREITVARGKKLARGGTTKGDLFVKRRLERGSEIENPHENSYLISSECTILQYYRIRKKICIYFRNFQSCFFYELLMFRYDQHLWCSLPIHSSAHIRYGWFYPFPSPPSLFLFAPLLTLQGYSPNPTSLPLSHSPLRPLLAILCEGLAHHSLILSQTQSHTDDSSWPRL